MVSKATVAAACRQIGDVAYLRRRPDGADDWHRKSLATFEELGDRPHMATSYYGPALPVDVEAALHAHGTQTRPRPVFRPVSVASLIVSIATLAWLGLGGQERGSVRPSV